MSRWEGEPALLGRGRFLQVQRIAYRAPTGPTPLGDGDADAGAAASAETAAIAAPAPLLQWEMCQRTTTSASGIDGAEIVVVLREAGASAANRGVLALVAQYRAPLDTTCVEFVAGLIDAGETPVAAALRELAEETGIADGRLGARVAVTRVSPPVCYEPGMTNSLCVIVEVDVALPPGLSAAAFRDGIAAHRQLEEAEQGIQLVLVPLDDAAGALLALVQRGGCRVDGKVWSYVVGRSAARA
jgi:ADP-ribose pyrophosphatase